MADIAPELKRGTVISGRYEITFPISDLGSFRARDIDGKPIRLALIPRSELPPSGVSEEGTPVFVSRIINLEHPCLGRLIDSGFDILNKSEYFYSAYSLRGSETLADRLGREGTMPLFKAISLACELLEGLDILHQDAALLVHNGINPNSVSLDYSSGVEHPVLYGFENLRSIHDPRDSILRNRLSVFHSAPELADGIFMPSSDLFSIGALLYHMIWGIPPWYSERVAALSTDDGFRMLRQMRRPLNPPPINNIGLPEEIFAAIRISLLVDPSRRFASAADFLKALKLEYDLTAVHFKEPTDQKVQPTESSDGYGFSGIAGLDELKSQLHNEVIRPIRERERFKRFGIPLINGILLYGPPGCGKTFIAERLAEEIGYNFMLITPSDLGSPYVHGGQIKIGEMFKEAQEKAPCMIFVDEIDAVLPSRDSGDLHHSYAAEVNEFLAQLSNCGEKEIFVLAATNKPDKMDLAALRAGRMDKIINIPPPDKDLRRAMFEMHLKRRPTASDIDFETLAVRTDKYVSADIFKIVVEAARKAEQADTQITANFLLDAIKENPPSVPASELERYEQLRSEWEDYRVDRTNKSLIGFIKPSK